MGNTIHFLVNRVGSNLDEAIDLINQSSESFKQCWQNLDLHGSNEASEIAIKNFDYIVNEIFRERDILLSSNNPQYEQAFKNILNSDVGEILINPSSVDFSNISPFNNIGKARIATGSNTKKVSLSKILNKIKHRKQEYLNFRIDNNEHLLFIAADAFQREPVCIVEFSVSNFCKECQKLSELIKKKVP